MENSSIKYAYMRGLVWQPEFNRRPHVGRHGKGTCGQCQYSHPSHDFRFVVCKMDAEMSKESITKYEPPDSFCNRWKPKQTERAN